MAADKRLAIARFLTVAAGGFGSIAAGTNYAYSAWAPAYAERMVLSSTQSNLVGTFGNLGMYICGIPLGMMIDARGPRSGALLGAVLVGTGYFGLYRSYLSGQGSIPLAVACLFNFLTGAGSAGAFFGFIKAAAVNYPDHHGTATAFPLAGYGLGAFFFSTAANLLLPNDRAGILLLLAVGTFSMLLIAAIFIRLLPPPPRYTRLAPQPTRRRSDAQKSRSSSLAGSLRRTSRSVSPDRRITMAELTLVGADAEASPRHVSFDEDITADEHEQEHNTHHSLYADVRGLAMFKYSEFYEFFILMGVLTGVGLMTINNIGNNAQALWTAWDDKVLPEAVQRLQKTQVSIISLGSFTGRLISGIGSDLIVKKLHKSRFWCMFASSCTFALAQVIAISLSNPNWLFLLSASNGLAYGFLFGVAPSLVAETFGTNGVSQNWGYLMIAPIIFSEVFNLMYGRTYDQHSVELASGRMSCLVGRSCYANAYVVTLIATLASLGMIIWCIHHRHRKQQRDSLKASMTDDDEHHEA